MSQATTAADSRKGLILLLTSLLIGLILAGAAAATVVSLSGPNDSGAITNGPKSLIVPDKTLGYGG